MIKRHMLIDALSSSADLFDFSQGITSNLELAAVWVKDEPLQSIPAEQTITVTVI